MIVNVDSKHSEEFSYKLRDELLAWVNKTLKAKFTKVEELCTGAAYCQLIHSVFPHAIAIRSVKFVTNLEHECIENFKVLQKAFKKLGITKTVPVNRLSKGNFQDNFEFLLWFHKFYGANTTRITYDPVAVRNGMPLKYGAVEIRRIYEQRAKEALKDKVFIGRMKAGFSEREIDADDKQQVVPKSNRHFIKRSATPRLVKSKSSHKSKKISISAGNSKHEINSVSDNPTTESINSSTDALNIPLLLRRSNTRTILKCRKSYENFSPSPAIKTEPDLSAENKKLSAKKVAASSEKSNEKDYETIINEMKHQLREYQRTIDKKNRAFSEREIEIIKLQNEVNQMRSELGEAKRDRDRYFDKMHRVAVCCRNAQYRAEVNVPISAVLEIFLDDEKKSFL